MKKKWLDVNPRELLTESANWTNHKLAGTNSTQKSIPTKRYFGCLYKTNEEGNESRPHHLEEEGNDGKEDAGEHLAHSLGSLANQRHRNLDSLETGKIDSMTLEFD